MQLNNSDKNDIIDAALSYIVAFAMFAYGLGKYWQFGTGSETKNRLVSELSGMELMWTFYGYSKPFVMIVGCLEIIGGLLLLSRKTRILACLFLTPILMNIILQDYFYGVHHGALIAALLYQSIIFVLLFRHRKQVFSALKSITDFELENLWHSKSWIKFGLAFLLFLVLRTAEHFLVMLS